MSKIREGNHDKAWNDPPVFAYDTASAAQATHKRTSLNKRVAFPVSGQTGSSSPVMPGHGPPPMAPGQGPPPMLPGQGPPPMLPGQGPPPMLPGQGPPPMLPGQGPPPMLPGQGPPPMLPGQGLERKSGEDSVAASDRQSTEQSLSASDIKEKLTRILNGLEKIEDKLKSDISLRVDVLASVLDAGRLSGPVQQRIGQMVSALEGGSLAAADRLQRALMVDYPAECGAWMPGIRQLIVHLSPPQDTAGGEAGAGAGAGAGEAGGQTSGADSTDSQHDS